MSDTYNGVDFAVAQSESGWWVAQTHTGEIDPAVLRAAGSDSLYDWDGVVGRYDSEQEAIEAAKREIDTYGDD